MVATIDQRRDAKRVMDRIRDHDRKRRMTTAPHRDQWGCGHACFTGMPLDNLTEAVRLGIHVGGIVITPEGLYAPGWMKPA